MFRVAASVLRLRGGGEALSAAARSWVRERWAERERRGVDEALLEELPLAEVLLDDMVILWDWILELDDGGFVEDAREAVLIYSWEANQDNGARGSYLGGLAATIKSRIKI